MFEELLKAARRANGEELETPRKKIPPPPSPRCNAPQKWYEKKWGVGLMLIICFPIGAIMLWQNPRYSNGTKGGITASLIFLFLFYQYSTYEPPPPSTYKYESAYTERSYEVSYLPSGATWMDDSERVRKNSSRVKVEVTGNKIVSASGGKLIQIYFLEGQNAGSWGYVRESALKRDDSYKSN